MLVRIGVLALQGSVIEHTRMLRKIEDVIPVEIKTVEDLCSVSGLIIPGGESTTIGKLIKDFCLYELIIKKAEEGIPIWGTCAGMILMAKEIIDENCVHLGIMDISVRRNAYGSQLDSFVSEVNIPAVSDKSIPLIFIRAPWVEKVGEGVKILAKVNGRIVAVQQGNMIATSFHPELTKNIAFHKYFVDLVKNTSNTNKKSG